MGLKQRTGTRPEDVAPDARTRAPYGPDTGNARAILGFFYEAIEKLNFNKLSYQAFDPPFIIMMNLRTSRRIVYLLISLFAFSLPINSLAQEWVVDLKEVKSLIEHWTEAHNTRDLPALERMYSDEVIFYAKTLPKVTCMGVKSKRLRSSRYFHLEITTNPVITTHSSKMIKAAFIKQVTSGTTTKDYDAYLLLKQIDGELLIVGESDLIADGEAGYSPDLGKELKQARLSEIPTAQDQKKLAEPDKRNSEERSVSSIDQKWIVIGFAGILISIIIYFTYKRLSTKQPRSFDKRDTDSNQLSPPEKVGLAFEKFVVNRFDNKYFKIIEWRGDKIVNGIYAESSKYPDLEIQFRFGGESRTFALECKYRRTLIKGEFKLEKKQFDNYSNFKNSKKISVYVALGLGGNPENPNDLFIIPLDAFNADGIIRYETILAFYNNPKMNFFYDLQKNELRYSRRPQ